MSDFFTRLAERTLGLALSIQPIKPSLFAPEADYDAAALLEIAEESAIAQPFSGTWQGVETPTTHAELALTKQADQPAPSVRSLASQMPAETPINGIQTQVKFSQPEQYNRSRAATSPSASPMETFSANAASTFTAAGDERKSTKQQASSRTSSSALSQTLHELHVASSHSPRVAPEQQDHILERRSTSSDTNLSPAALVETAITLHEQTTSRQVILGERAIRGAQSSSSIATPPKQQEALTALSAVEAATEPAIQVTIGRVEVRAVTASATATRSQQQPARPPAMSLDEYLRQQERGGRR